jgi:hypothetical protein
MFSSLDIIKLDQEGWVCEETLKGTKRIGKASV